MAQLGSAYSSFRSNGGDQRPTPSSVVMPQTFAAVQPIKGSAQYVRSSPLVPSGSFTAPRTYGASSGSAVTSGFYKGRGPAQTFPSSAGPSYVTHSAAASSVPTPVPSTHSVQASATSAFGSVRTPVSSTLWSIPAAVSSTRTAVSHSTSGSPVSKDSAHIPHHEDWLTPMISNLWPKIVGYIEEKVKTTLHGKNIYIDPSVHRVMQQLSLYPPTIPFGKDWMNTVLKVMWPLVKHAAENMIKNTILPELRKALPSFLQSIEMDPCNLGDTAPQIKSLEVLTNHHHLATNRFLCMKVELEYDGDADIGFVFHGMRAGIRHTKARLTMFLNFAGKADSIPFFKGVSINADNFGFSMDWTGAVDFLDGEFMEDVIHNLVKDIVHNMMVLPQRYVVSLIPMGAGVFDLVRPPPKGFLKVELLGITGLKGDEISLTTFMGGGRTVDPFVEFRIGSQFWKSTTVSRSLDPTWEEDNTFIFMVDSPGHQLLDLRVFDEDLTTGMRMAMGASAADTIARALDLRMRELLVKGKGHNYQDEIHSDLWIPLALWWPGQGKGPEQEDFQAPTATMTEAERVDSTYKARGDEEGHRHVEAQEHMRQRHEAFVEQQRKAMELEETEAANAGYLTQVKNWFKKEAAEATEWVKEEAEYIMEGAEHMYEVAKDEALHLKDKAMEKVHSHQEANEQARKEILLQADAKIHIRFDWRPIGDSTPATFPLGGTITKPTLQRMLEETPSDPLDSDAAAPEWPSYALLVGIAKVDKIIIADEKATECYVTCDVTPVFSQDGKIQSDSKDIVTKKRSATISPTRASVAGLTADMDSSRVMARKIGLCLAEGMPVPTIADVLDIEESAVLKAVGSAITERSDCVDVELNEDFVYFLHDAEAAMINLTVFRNGKSIGTQSMCVRPLLQKPGMTEDFERLPVVSELPDEELGTIPRLTGRVQLWPLSKGSPRMPSSTFAPPRPGVAQS